MSVRASIDDEAVARLATYLSPPPSGQSDSDHCGRQPRT
jgi:hypothetical protein